MTELSAFNTLRQGEGQIDPLKHNGYFERGPHPYELDGVFYFNTRDDAEKLAIANDIKVMQFYLYRLGWIIAALR